MEEYNKSNVKEFVKDVRETEVELATNETTRGVKESREAALGVNKDNNETDRGLR